MALKDRIPFGMVLPHRFANPLPVEDIRRVAQRADEIGFRDLWVTENTLDDAYSLDAMVILTYAAAVTRRIGLGAAVVVLPVHHPIHIAHQIASLDYLSNGRAILGIGIGNKEDYHDFQVPLERRVRRFRERVELMKALWTRERVHFQGEIFNLPDSAITLKPIQKPHPPLWLGGLHPDALSRAVELGSGWIGGGVQTSAGFASTVPALRNALDKAGRDPAGFTISKRIFMAVDDNAATAKAEVHRWFTDVYRRPHLADTAGAYGTPEQVREQLEELISAGATHLLLNAISRYPEQVEALAEVVGLK